MELTNSSSASDALSALGLTVEEVAEIDHALMTRSPRDNRICLCGHGVSKHTEMAGVVNCKPSAMDCPCKKIRPVIETNDTRMFLRSTQGGGAMHALSRGLSALAMAGKSATWLIELKCDRCGAVDEVVVPVPITSNGHSANKATGFDALLCPNCRDEV